MYSFVRILHRNRIHMSDRHWQDFQAKEICDFGDKNIIQLQKHRFICYVTQWLLYTVESSNTVLARERKRSKERKKPEETLTAQTTGGKKALRIG